MKSVILFDLDGTLLYTLPSITAAMNRTLKRFGLEAISLERVRELVGNSSRYLVEHAIKESGGSDWSKEQCEHFLDAYNTDYLSHPIEGTTPYPGAEALLDALKEEGKQLWVYSNKPDAIAKQVVHHFFGMRFDRIRGYREDTPRKPHPEGVYALLEESGKQAKDVLYIGDSEVDWKLAQAAGLDMLLLSYGFRREEELRKTTTATSFIASPEELQKKLLTPACGYV